MLRAGGGTTSQGAPCGKPQAGPLCSDGNPHASAEPDLTHTTGYNRRVLAVLRYPQS
jgi:hypothetical protein